MESLIIPIVDKNKKKVSIKNSLVKNFDKAKYLDLNDVSSWKKFLVTYNLSSRPNGKVYFVNPVLSTVTFVKKEYENGHKENLLVIHFHHYAAHSIFRNLSCPNALVVSFTNGFNPENTLKQIADNFQAVKSINFDSRIYKEGTQTHLDFQKEEVRKELIRQWDSENYTHGTPLIKRNAQLFKLNSNIQFGLAFIPSKEQKIQYKSSWYWFNPERFFKTHNNPTLTSKVNGQYYDFDVSFNEDFENDHIWYEKIPATGFSSEVKMANLFNIPKSNISIPPSVNHLISKDELLFLDGGILKENTGYKFTLNDNEVIDDLGYKKDDFVIGTKSATNKKMGIIYHKSGNFSQQETVEISKIQKATKLSIFVEQNKELKCNIISNEYEVIKIKNAINRCKRSNRKLEKWLNTNKAKLDLFQQIKALEWNNSEFKRKILDKAISRRDKSEYKTFEAQYIELKENAQKSVGSLHVLYKKYCLIFLEQANKYKDKLDIITEAFYTLASNGGLDKLKEVHGDWKSEELFGTSRATLVSFKVFKKVISTVKNDKVLDGLLHFKIFGLDAMFIKKHADKFYHYDLINKTYSENIKDKGKELWKNNFLLDLELQNSLDEKFKKAIQVNVKRETIQLPTVKHVTKTGDIIEIRGPRIETRTIKIRKSDAKLKCLLNYSSLLIDVLFLPASIKNAVLSNDFKSWSKLSRDMVSIASQVTNIYLEISLRNSPNFTRRSISSNIAFPFLFISLAYEVEVFSNEYRSGNEISAIATISASMLPFLVEGVSIIFGFSSTGLGVVVAFFGISLMIVALIYKDSKPVLDFKNMFLGKEPYNDENYKHWKDKYHLQLAHVRGYIFPIKNFSLETNINKTTLKFSLPKKYFKENSRILVEFKAETKRGGSKELLEYRIGFLLSSSFNCNIKPDTKDDFFPKLYEGFIRSPEVERECTFGSLSIKIDNNFNVELVFNEYKFRKTTPGSAYSISEFHFASVIVSAPLLNKDSSGNIASSNKELDTYYKHQTSYNFSGGITSATLITPK